MNVLERALIEKTEHENSWENVLESRDELVRLASARHRARVGIMPAEGANWRVELPGGRPIRELARSLQVQPDGDGRCAVFGMDGLTGEKVSDRSYRYAVALFGQARGFAELAARLEPGANQRLDLVSVAAA
jgi:hypothetical protein